MKKIDQKASGTMTCLQPGRTLQMDVVHLAALDNMEQCKYQ